MTVRKWMRLLLVLLLGVAGCSASDIPPPPPAEDAAAPSGAPVAAPVPAPVEASGPPVAAVFSLDVSGSGAAALREQCFDVARGAIRDAAPGDHVQVRLIGDLAYSASSLAADLRVPRSTRGSAYDLRARASRGYAARVDSLRRAAAADLEKAAGRPPASRTDIYGSIAAAADALRESPPGAVRAIVVCSDGKETAGEPIDVDLAGIRVVYLLAAGSRDRSQDVVQRREFWRERLAAAGARVQFRAPGEEVLLEELRATDQPVPGRRDSEQTR